MSKPASIHWVTLALIFGACCIGLAPIMVKVAHTTPTLSAAWRLLIAAPATMIWAWLEWRKAPFKIALAHMGGFGLAGLWFALDLITWHAGIVRTSAANATFFANLTPVLLIIGGMISCYMWPSFAAIFPPQRFLWRRILLIAVAILGAYLMSRGAVHVTARATWGDALSGLTALWYALYLAQVANLRRQYPTGVIMAASSVIGAIILWGVVAVSGGPLLPNPPNIAGFWPLIVLGLVCHTLGQGLLAYALGRIDTALAAIIILCQPVMAALVGYGALGETLGIWQIAGGVLVLVAVARARLEAVKT